MKKKYHKCIIPKLIRLSALVAFHNNIYRSGFSSSGEMHNFWEIMCIINGTAEIVCEDNVYILKGGQAFVHKPMNFHTIKPAGNTPIQSLVICFHADAMPNFNRRIFKLSPDTADALQKLCRQGKTIFNYADNSGEPLSIIEGKNFEASMFLSALEYHIHCIFNDTSEILPQSVTQSVENYRKILSVMESNIDKNLSLPEISQLCNMREPTLRKVFYQYSGISVMKYFKTMKIKKSMIYLQEGKSVKETAHLLGFNDQNYFSTVFKRITGTPPKEFIPNSEESFHFQKKRAVVKKTSLST